MFARCFEYAESAEENRLYRAQCSRRATLYNKRMKDPAFREKQRRKGDVEDTNVDVWEINARIADGAARIAAANAPPQRPSKLFSFTTEHPTEEDLDAEFEATPPPEVPASSSKLPLSEKAKGKRRALDILNSSSSTSEDDSEPPVTSKRLRLVSPSPSNHSS